MAATKTLKQRQNDFLIRLKKLYPDYKLISDYINADTFVILEHKDGYIWKTKPRYLNGKRQCNEVSLKTKSKNLKELDNEEFIRRFYEKYSKEEYEILEDYESYHKPIKILHKKCGHEFQSTPSNLLTINKRGCTYCYGKFARNIEYYQNKFKEKGLNDYEILNIESINGHIYGNIKHDCELCKNSIFNIRLSDMISKHNQRCPNCANIKRESYAVSLITNLLEKNKIEFIKEKTFKGCKNKCLLRFDFYVPKIKVAIEYDGIQHFFPIEFFGGEKDFEIRKKNDIIKNEYCKNNHIDLIRISYKQDIETVLNKCLFNKYFE